MTIYPALSPSHLFSQFAFYSSASQYTSVNILPQERFQKRKDLPLLLPTHASSLSLGISSVLFVFAVVSPRQGDAEERSFHIGKLWHFHSVSPQTGLLLLLTSDLDNFKISTQIYPSADFHLWIYCALTGKRGERAHLIKIEWRYFDNTPNFNKMGVDKEVCIWIFHNLQYWRFYNLMQRRKQS